MKNEINAKSINQVFAADVMDCSHQKNNNNKDILDIDLNALLSSITDSKLNSQKLSEEDLTSIAQKVRIIVEEIKAKGEDNCDTTKIKNATSDIKAILGNIGQAVEWVFKISSKLGL